MNQLCCWWDKVSLDKIWLILPGYFVHEQFNDLRANAAASKEMVISSDSSFHEYKIVDAIDAHEPSISCHRDTIRAVKIWGDIVKIKTYLILNTSFTCLTDPLEETSCLECGGVMTKSFMKVSVLSNCWCHSHNDVRSLTFHRCEHNCEFEGYFLYIYTLITSVTIIRPLTHWCRGTEIHWILYSMLHKVCFYC